MTPGQGRASMGPTSFNVGDVYFLPNEFHEFVKRLQWGRRLSTSETGNGSVTTVINEPASMGPTSFNVGDRVVARCA